MKKQYFNKGIFTENIKRFWSISLISFIGYYLTGIDYIIQYLGEKNYISADGFGSLLYAMFNNEWLWLFFNAATPFVAAFLVFQYMLNSKSSNLIHSLPCSRTSLFVSNFASGLVLSFMPVVMTFICLIILKRPVMLDVSTLDMYQTGVIDCFSWSMMFGWVIKSAAIIIFSFCITTLGIIVSGNPVIGALTGFTANIILPILVLCFYGLASTYLWGVNISLEDSLLSYTSPFMCVFKSLVNADYHPFDLEKIIYYLLFSLVVAICTCFIYNKRRNEKVGDAYVYTAMEHIVGFIFVFVPCCLAEFVLFDLWGSMSYVYGGIIGFTLGQMISRRTFRILDKKGIRNAVVYFLIMLAIVVGFKNDILGLEKAVPKTKNIVCAEVTSDIFSSDGTQQTIILYGEDAELAADINNYLISNKIKGNNTDYYSNGFVKVVISYKLKSGRHTDRQYIVPIETAASSEEFKALYDKKVKMDYSGLKDFDPDFIGIVCEIYDEEKLEYYYVPVSDGESSVKDIMDCIVDDLNNLDFAKNIENKKTNNRTGSLSITYHLNTTDKSVAEEFVAAYPINSYIDNDYRYGPNSTLDITLDTYMVRLNFRFYKSFEKTKAFLDEYIKTYPNSIM